MSRRGRLAVTLVVMVGIAALPGTAHADAAGPTDFRTEIVSITPAPPDITVSIVGGDAFVRIAAEPGTEVEVLGYDGEPYVRIGADGLVFENQRSYATFYNSSRYGTDAIPDDVDNTATPEWEQVGSGGAWAWHDHRAHWMGTEPPLGMRAGDALPAQVIPLLVDGTPVEVAVVSTLVGGPSWWPAIAGSLTALLVTAVALAFGREALAALLWSIAALTVGLAQYLSLPAETGPRPIWWLPPAVAVACAVAAVAWRRSPVLYHGLVAIAGAQIVLWGFVRRYTFTRPVLPTDMPYWLDRCLSASAVTGALLLVGAAVGSLVTLVRQPVRAASIASSSAS